MDSIPGRMPLELLATLSLIILATSAPASAQDEGDAPPAVRSPAAARLLAACGQGQGQRAIPTQPYALPAYVARGFASPDFRPSRTLDELRAALQATSPQDPRAADLEWDLGLALLWRSDTGAAPANDQDEAEAIRTLATFARDRPGDQRRDQALYLLGRVLMERSASAPSDLQQSLGEQARRVFRELIRSHPTSPYVPNAFAQFGDYYFERGDMESATAFYERTLRFPGPANRVFGYALHRLAWCRLNLQDHVGAANRFAELIEYTGRNPTTPDAAELGARARLELCLTR